MIKRVNNEYNTHTQSTSSRFYLINYRTQSSCGQKNKETYS